MPTSASQLTATDHLYRALAGAVFPAVRLLARARGASPDELRARAGFLPPATPPLLWFHGASAGELTAAAHLVRLLRRAGYAFHAGLTTTNDAGLEAGRRAAGTHDQVSLAPWDAPSWVERAFSSWNPRLMFLVETEVWPSLLLTAARRGIPALCVSARVYPRDFRRYLAGRPFLASTFARLVAVLAQSEEERRRFVRLGAAPEACVVAGNLKHLAVAGEVLSVGGERRFVVCGSIHTDEVAGLFSALEALRDADAPIVIAPRHRRGIAAVVREAERRSWRLRRRSSDAEDPASRILLLDTMGELPSFYAAGRVAVVGGGFARHGGHNLLEPVVAGAPVLFGPHCEHFPTEVRALRSAAPAAQVASWSELGRRLRELVEPHAARSLHERQRRALPDPRRVAARYLEALAPWLERAGIECRGGGSDRALSVSPGD